MVSVSTESPSSRQLLESPSKLLSPSKLHRLLSPDSEWQSMCLNALDEATEVLSHTPVDNHSSSL